MVHTLYSIKTKRIELGLPDQSLSNVCKTIPHFRGGLMLLNYWNKRQCDIRKLDSDKGPGTDQLCFGMAKGSPGILAYFDLSFRQSYGKKIQIETTV